MDEMNPADTPAGTTASAYARPPGLVRRLYREERDAWRKHYRKYFKYAARALGLGFVAGFVFFLVRPDQEQKALVFVVRALEDIRLEGSPLVLALTLFYHNAQASVVAVAAGFVPFAFLSILDPIINGGVLGLLCSVSKHHGLDVPRLVLTQIMPHGVFELTAVVYTTSLGLYLSSAMGRKMAASWKARRSKARTAPPAVTPPPPAARDFLENYVDRAATVPESPARNVVRSFVLVVLPLLLVAAAIEGFITPHLR
jgi:stage II sporulation protein M